MKPLPAILFVVLALSPIPALAAVSGVAISSEGVALPDVKVTAYAQESSAARRERLMKGAERETLTSAVTDAKGLLTIDVKDAIVFDLEFRKPGHAPASLRVTHNENIGAVMLRAAADRSGVIRAGGKPVPEALVVFGSQSGSELIIRTDENGRYLAPDPDQWAETMSVLHPDFARTVVPRRPRSRWTMDASVTAGITHSGRVVATDGKTPVADARIFVDGWPAGESGEDGSFSLSHLPSNWTEMRAVKAEQIASQPRGRSSTSTLRMGKASSVTGTVTEAGGRRPVRDAMIWMMPAGRQGDRETVISDAKGNFNLPSLTAGTFRFGVSVPGYSDPVASDISISPGEAVARSFALSRSGSLDGVILDENGKAVAGASVTADRRPPGMPNLRMSIGSPRGYSAPDGRFVVRDLAPSEGYNVQANREGFAEGREIGIDVVSGERKSGVRITLPSGYELSGRVADQRGRAIGGATIVATKSLPGVRTMTSFFFASDNKDVPTSSAEGSFSLRLAEGNYDLEIRREGFAPKRLPNVRVERNTDPLKVVLVEGVAVAGRVVTASGSPVADANINLGSGELGPLGATVTAIDGSFAIEDLAAGTAILSVNKLEDFISFSQSVTAPDPNLLIELPAGGGISGRVVDSNSKQPLTSFSAGLSNVRAGGGAMRRGPPMMKDFRSDDGSFVLENVPVGQHQVQVTAPGYVTAQLSGVNVEEGKSVRDLEVLMEPGVRVTGKVTGPDGAGLEAVFISAEDPSDRMVMGPPGAPNSTNADGEYVIENLQAGERTLRFSKRGYQPEQKAVKISGKEARVDVRLSRGLELTGTVVDASGRPVAEASVMAQAPGAGGRASSNANGAFTIEGLAAGRYTVTASKTGLASERLRDVDIATVGPLRIVLDTGGTIYGRVSGYDETLASTIVVRASNQEGNAQSSIDASGNFRIEGAPVGTVTVLAMSRGSNSGSKQVEVVSGQSHQVDLEFRSDIVISGRVSRNGKAADFSSVSFMPSDARLQSRGSGATDAEGRYSISGLEPGDYNVSVMDQNTLQPYRTTYKVTGSANFDIDVRGATLRGRVVDAESGEGIPDARISLSQKGDRPSPTMFQPSTVSAWDGNFTLEHVPAGSYQLLAQKQGWGHQILDLSVEGEFAQDALVKLSKNDGLVLRVVDARDGRPLAANVLAKDASNRIAYQGFGSREADGSTRISIAAGTYRVAIGAGGYATRTVMVAVPGETSIGLTPGGAISVTVSEPDRQMGRLLLATGEAYLRNPWSPNSDFALNPGGNVLANILPGGYTLVTLDEKGQVKKSQQITVTEGQTTEVRM